MHNNYFFIIICYVTFIYPISDDNIEGGQENMMKNPALFNKTLVIGIIFLLIGICANPSIGIIMEKESNNPITNGNTLYVGGTGPNNYTQIQDAINDATDGDTVYVYDDSSPYYENIWIDKSINLIGENRDTTLIDGSENGNVVCIKSDGVSISGFTIMHSEYEYIYAGIEIYEASNITVSNNIITENNFGISVRGEHQHNYYTVNNMISDNIISSNIYFGIWLTYCNYSTVTNNVIIDNVEQGIHTNFACYNTISGNHVENNQNGITLFQFSNNNIVSGNKFANSKYHGIYLRESNGNILSGNNVTNNNLRGIYFRNSNRNNISQNRITNNRICGLTMEGAYSNFISQNNFIDNGVSNVRYVLMITRIFEKNKWDGNYWGKPVEGIHLIYGKISLFGFIFGTFPWFQIDRNPAKEPYDI